MMDSSLRRLVGTGLIVGLIAGMMLAMFFMLASATYLGLGFFTPLYGVAAPLVGKHAMVTSMKEGVYFTAGPALLGLMVHMMWSALYGVVFGLLVRATHLAGLLGLLAGLVYGVLLVLLMGLVILPPLGAGAMPQTLTWPSFTVGHLLFGMVLGLWPLLRPQDFGVRQAREGHSTI